MQSNHWIGIALGVIVVVTVAYGFDSKQSRLVTCETRVNSYVVAHYSEYIPETCIDFEDMMPYDCSTTNSWTDAASDVYRTVSINGELINTSHEFSTNERGGVFYPPMPAHDVSMSRINHFDNFQRKTDGALTVVTKFLEVQDTFIEPMSKTLSCIEKIDKFIEVKSWYGRSYGSDF